MHSRDSTYREGWGSVGGNSAYHTSTQNSSRHSEELTVHTGTEGGDRQRRETETMKDAEDTSVCQLNEPSEEFCASRKRLGNPFFLSFSQYNSTILKSAHSF